MPYFVRIRNGRVWVETRTNQDNQDFATLAEAVAWLREHGGADRMVQDETHRGDLGDLPEMTA